LSGSYEQEIDRFTPRVGRKDQFVLAKPSASHTDDVALAAS
jgi:hypothetical protein